MTEWISYRSKNNFANMATAIKTEMPPETKTEPHFYHEKENCEDVSESSNLVVDFTCKNREVVTKIKQELPDRNDEFSQDYVGSESPVLPVMLNEGNDNARDSVAEDEMKYEDDIEEEEYDSDEESISVDHYETFSFGKSPGSANSCGSINESNTEVDSCHSEQSVSYFNANHFELASLNHQKGARFRGNNVARYSDANDIVNDLRKEAGDEPTDSVLLSIVYATINVPFSQVSKFLTAYNLSKSQLSVIRKVRRQVKNRLYAQNCRRRRVAHIKNLTNEVKKIKNEKERLLTERGDLMVKKMSLQLRYKHLQDHVMGVLANRSRKDSLLQFADSNMNLSDDSQTNILKRKLAQERVQWEAKKRKLENQYDQLHSHVFSVISNRSSSGDGVTIGGLNEDNLDFKLCNMNIANELEMLNKYYQKNATALADADSNASVDDDSTFSENKLDDLIEYESGNGSRTEESHHDSNDFINDGETDVMTKSDRNDKRSDNSAENWSGTSEIDEDEEEEEEEENGEQSEDEVEFALDELDNEYDKLEITKKCIQDKYELLYDYVFKALKMNEIDFMKAFMDYCLQLLAAKVPDRDLCSFAFGRS